MADIISQEEIDALVSAFGPQEQGERLEAEGRNRQIKTYDFTRPDRFSKEQLRTLHLIHSGFARLLSQSLSPYLRTPVHVELTGVDQISYGEYLRAISDPAVVSIFSLEPLHGSAAFEIHPELGFAMVDRLLGGHGVPTAKAREMSEIDQALLRRVVERALEHYAEAWAQLVHLTPSLKLMVSNMTFNQIALRSDMVLMAALEARLGANSGSMSLCVPISLLEPILAKLNAQQWFAAGRQGQGAGLDQRAHLEERIRGTELECVVELGGASVTLSDLLELQPGDLLKLDRPADADLELKVDGRTRLLGRVGTVGTRMGFVTTRVASIQQDDPLIGGE